MDRYEVFLYNVPKLSEDGKSEVPTPPSEKKDFESLDEASRCAADHREKFDRVVLIRVRGEDQKMLERYSDGRHETFADTPEQASEAS
jgi:hypothetical protein